MASQANALSNTVMFLPTFPTNHARRFRFTFPLCPHIGDELFHFAAFRLSWLRGFFVWFRWLAVAIGGEEIG
jgi:hypothetical protein